MDFTVLVCLLQTDGRIGNYHNHWCAPQEFQLSERKERHLQKLKPQLEKSLERLLIDWQVVLTLVLSLHSEDEKMQKFVFVKNNFSEVPIFTLSGWATLPSRNTHTVTRPIHAWICEKLKQTRLCLFLSLQRKPQYTQVFAQEQSTILW